jgi:hypothetical protein
MSCVGEPSPPKLEGKLQTTGNALKVNWIKQDDGGSPIKHYLIRYRAVSMTEHGGLTLCIPICFLVFPPREAIQHVLVTYLSGFIAQSLFQIRKKQIYSWILEKQKWIT